MSWLKPRYPDDVIDLTASSDEEKGEPAWRVERRMRSVARLALRVRPEESPPLAELPPRQRRESSTPPDSDEDKASIAGLPDLLPPAPIPRLRRGCPTPLNRDEDTSDAAVAAASPTSHSRVHDVNGAAVVPPPQASAIPPPQAPPPQAQASTPQDPASEVTAVVPPSKEPTGDVAALVPPPQEPLAGGAGQVDPSSSSCEPNNKGRKPDTTGDALDQQSDLYRAWHGDATNAMAPEGVYFDWVSVRQRAKLCRTRLEKAAGELEDERKPASSSIAEASGASDNHAVAVGDSDTALNGTVVEFFRHLKACWVTTHTNGVTTREWRPPSRPLTATKTKFTKVRSHSKKVTAPASDRAMTQDVLHGDAKSETVGNREGRKSRKASQAVVRRFPRFSPPPPQFVDKQWPPGIICLGQMFNPLDIKFRFDSPFVGDCECVDSCRYSTCPNGILGMFCSPACCNQSDRCGNSLKEHASLRLVRRRGSSELAVIATAKIAAGEALGEYRGELQAVKKKPAVVAGQQVTHPLERNSGYRYKMKRSSETHPNHNIYIDAEHMGGITRFMNHSCAANSVFQEMRNGRVHTAVVVTKREILPGEEVTVHYGQDLWFICRCGEPSCQHRDIQHLENPF